AVQPRPAARDPRIAGPHHGGHRHSGVDRSGDAPDRPPSCRLAGADGSGVLTMALERLRITIEHTGAHFDVMFNPAEYTVNTDNNCPSKSTPGRGGPLLQFVQGNLRTLEMELFFDTFEQQRDVRQETRRVVDLLNIDPQLHAPPVLQVAWSSLQLRCVLARVSQKVIKFFEDRR